jgi:hypothetical protein
VDPWPDESETSPLDGDATGELSAWQHRPANALPATAVLAALVVNAAFGWWQADPAAGYVLVF